MLPVPASLADRRLPRPFAARALRARAERFGLRPIAIRLGGDLPLLLHEPAAPETRARFRDGERDVLLALTPIEFAVLATADPVRSDGFAADWGMFPAAPGEEDDARHRRRMRTATGLLWAADPHDPAAEARLRAVLASETSPTRFPPMPSRRGEVRAAMLGLCHAGFAGEIAIDPADGAMDVGWPKADLDATSLSRVVLDLPRHVRDVLRAVSVWPGPVGATGGRVVLSFDDAAPLGEAARAADLVDGLLALSSPRSSPVFAATVSALHGMVRRRLFPRPSQRGRLRGVIAILGDDPLEGGFVGPDLTRSDLRAEVAALHVELARAWVRGADLAAIRDGFGAVLCLHAGVPASAFRDALRNDADPGVASLFSDADPDPSLRSLGPRLVRLGEVAAERVR
jgi:hypothetical protein